MSDTINWITISTIVHVDEAIANSSNRPSVFFKHSVTCGISAAAEHRLQSKWNFSGEDMNFYYLDLLAHRSVSNYIAEKLGVIHQSPQIIVVKDGEVIFHNSHHSISVETLAGGLVV